jgi:molecular chaperone GrpE
VKVPIDVENDEVREDVEEVVEPDLQEDELTPEEEAAMVEAAKRAGAEAAEADMAAEAERAQSDLQDQLNAAIEESEAAKKEAADATDRLLRLQADWDNYRRRTAAERIAERERAAEKLVTNLLPVLDDMERASEHATQNAEGDEKVTQFVEGVMAVHAKMLDILSKEGVEVIDPAGEAFDPLVHQAVGRVEDAEAYDETVAQVYQKGYRMGGKVIRSAMVTVTYGGPKRPVETAEE